MSSSKEPIWLYKEIVLTIHDTQISEHGGSIGIRDEGLLDSALSRPRNKFSYGEPDLFDLAAAYAFGIASNHPFVDGNKRVACAVAFTFLLLNRYDIEAQPDEVEIFLKLAAGQLEEPDLAAWFRQVAKGGG